MNEKKLHRILANYIENKDKLNKEKGEQYKYDFFENYPKLWNKFNEQNIVEQFEKLFKELNLGEAHGLKTLAKSIKKRPTEFVKYFEQLFNEKSKLVNRITNFTNHIKDDIIQDGELKNKKLFLNKIIQIRNFALFLMSYDIKMYPGFNYTEFEKLMYKIDKEEKLNRITNNDPVTYLEYYNFFHDKILRLVKKIDPKFEFTGLDMQNICILYGRDCDRCLYFKKDEVDSFINAINTKPFVILAGISGTGKTQLARIVARDWEKQKGKFDFAQLNYVNNSEIEFYSLEKENNAGSAHISFTPVRPDWTDNKKIWGYLNPLETNEYGNKEFYATDILRLVLRANKNLNKKYFIILDEMNLARVEYYFSDILSLMESDGETILLHTGDDKVVDAESGRDIPKKISFPKNITIIGTVNVDETTFSFAPKVLDRAFVLEFLDVEYELLFPKPKKKGEKLPPLLSFCNDLKNILEPINLHFGYRTVAEMKKYTKEAGGNPENHFDFLLKSKVLPKLHGTISDLELPLKQLFIYCKEGNMKLENDEVIKKWEEVKDKKDLKYPASSKKIRSMIRRLEGTGFTSFF